MPLPTAWAEQILSVHMIGRAPPTDLQRLVRQVASGVGSGWRAPVHTPNGESLAASIIAEREFWAVQNAVFGYWLHPARARGPSDLTGREGIIGSF